MTNITESELVTVEGGDLCMSIFGYYPTWVEDGDWCVGVRISA